MLQQRLTRRSLLGASGAAGALFLAACSGGNNNSSGSKPVATTSNAANTARGTSAPAAPGGAATSPPASATRAAASATAAGSPAAAGPKPVNGSYYNTHNVTTASTLDIHRELYRANIYNLGLAYSNLIYWADVDKSVVAPDLATKLPEQPDPTTFVFTIRSDVKWHNKPPANGRALTMDDIKWNIERQRSQKLVDGTMGKNFYRWSQIYNRIDNVEYTDATHLKVKLSSPDATWISNMADEFNGIGYKDVFEAIEKDFGTYDPKYIVGTGPYIWDSYTPTKSMHAVRNPDYYRKKDGQDVQFFDEFNIVNLGTDDNAIRTAFEQKQIDLMTSASRDLIDAIVAAQPTAKKLQIANPEGSLEMAYDHIKNPLYANPKLRQAVFVAIDRVLAGQQRFGGLSRPNPGIPWGFTAWAIPQNELVTMPGYRTNKDDDLKEARDLWKAGGGDAIDKSAFELVTLTGNEAMAEWFPAMLNKNLGTDKFFSAIKPAAAGLDYLAGAPAIAYFGGWGQWASPDPRQRFFQVRRRDEVNNFWKYDNPQLEDIAKKVFAEFDLAKATALMKDAQKLIMTDAGASHIDICGPIAQWVYWPYLHREGPTFIRYEKQLGARSWIDQTDPTFQGRKKG